MPTVIELVQLQSTLRPCKQCGAPAELRITDETDIYVPAGFWYAYCSNLGQPPNYNGCGAEIWTEPNQSVSETIRLWNTGEYAIIRQNDSGEWVLNHERKRNYVPLIPAQ